jgi:ATP/maltotriose-dependent transcriptional regulator MalT
MLSRLANFLFRFSSERADLIGKLQEASTARTLLQDRLTAAEEDRARLAQELSESHANEVAACHRLEDFLAQRNWGISIHGEAPQIPARGLTEEPQAMPARGIQARRLARMITRKTLAEVYRRQVGVAPEPESESEPVQRGLFD